MDSDFVTEEPKNLEGMVKLYKNILNGRVSQPFVLEPMKLYFKNRPCLVLISALLHGH